jgi:rod shape-determining protein MreC
MILLSLTLMTLQIRHKGLTTPIERVIMATFGPLQALAHKPVSAFRSFISKISTMKTLRESNTLLRSEVHRLRTVETAFQELYLRHERLQSLLRFQRQASFKTVAASVIARDATNWSRTITLNVGSDWGVRQNLPVLNHEGIVGHVIRAAPRHSQVLLITDARGAVDALVQRTRTAGVFVGSSNGRHGGQLRYVPREEDVRIDDRVISSGYGGIYPKGILLGVVKKVDRSGTGMFQTVDVEPAVDFFHLEEVIVILDQPSDP